MTDLPPRALSPEAYLRDRNELAATALDTLNESCASLPTVLRHPLYDYASDPLVADTLMKIALGYARMAVGFQAEVGLSMMVDEATGLAADIAALKADDVVEEATRAKDAK